MHFTSTTSVNGVSERTFTLGEITGVLFSPSDAVSAEAAAPLLLAGHAGGMHKRAPGLLASARHSVTSSGFSVAAIDAPGHGDRPRSLRDEQATEQIGRARAAGKSIAPIVADYTMWVAQRAVPEWRATLDALQTLPEIDVEVPVGYGGVSLGVVTGLMLAATDSRIAALSLGGVFVDDAVIEAARQVSVPVEYRIPWDDKYFDRAASIALFDAFASSEKTLHAHSGRHYPVPAYELESSTRFFARYLLPTADPATS